jgi:hypothetical protein
MNVLELFQIDADAPPDERVSQRAWNYANDLMRLPECVRFTPEVQACACIYLATAERAVALPRHPPWWQLFDATLPQIEEIAFRLKSLCK